MLYEMGGGDTKNKKTERKINLPRVGLKTSTHTHTKNSVI